MTTAHEDAARRYDRDGVLKDGETLRVPVMMMDGNPDIAAITRKALADAYQPSASGVLHKPGTLVADGIQAQIDATERQVRRDLRLDQLTDAWRNPPSAEVKKDTAAPTTDLDAFHERRNARIADAWKGAA
jgi:hypothetical protein